MLAESNEKILEQKTGGAVATQSMMDVPMHVRGYERVWYHVIAA